VCSPKFAAVSSDLAGIREPDSARPPRGKLLGAGYAHPITNDFQTAAGLFLKAWRWTPWWVKPAVYGGGVSNGLGGMRLPRASPKVIAKARV
jgi:hypothetical protein